MSFEWIRENPPHWDEGKAEILGAAPQGAFEVPSCDVGDLLPGEWWRVEQDGDTVGYGWMDLVWGEAEILLAARPASRSCGVGTFILDNLEREAGARGLRYMFNVVRETHPEADAVTRWLKSRRFVESGDGQLRRLVEQRA